MRALKNRINSRNLIEKNIDTHTHCGGMDLSNFYKFRYPSSQDILDLDYKRQKANIDYQIVFPMVTSIYYDIPRYWKEAVFVPSGYSEFPFQIENEILLRQIEYFGIETMLPFLAFSLQDKVSEQVNNIESLNSEYEIYGLKYHTKVDQKNADAIDKESPFVDVARSMNIPIVIHTEQKGCSSAIGVIELASRHLDVRFCCAHFGGFSKQFFCELDKYPYDNIFFDTCPLLARCADLSSSRGEEIMDLNYNNPIGVLEYFAQRFPNRILWGTDSPWTYYCALNKGEDNKSVVSELGYEKEAELLLNSKFRNSISDNTVKYIFGEELS